MARSLKSVIKKGADTLHRSNLNTLRNSITSSATTELYRTNSFMDADFYDGENYKSIIQCLNEGYNIYNDLIEFMQDYHDLQQDYSISLVSFSKKAKSKLKDQSALSSYHTTKRAQRDTINTAEQLAGAIDGRCAAIQNLIKELRTEVGRHYPSRGLGKAPKHSRADSLKDEFKSARSPVKRAEEKIEQLQTKREKAKAAADEAGIALEKITYGAPTSESKSDRAKRKHEEKKGEVESIDKQIDQTQAELETAKNAYREQANVIFMKCQVIEGKRLELIRATLVKFIQTIDSDDQSEKIDGIYTNALSKLDTDQNTAADLKFWAETYGIHFSSPLPTISETPVTTGTVAAATSSQEAATPTVSESTVPKTKVKRNKSSAEPTTPTIQE